MDKKQIIAQAKKHFLEASTGVKKNRSKAREDLEFIAGEQSDRDPSSRNELQLNVNLLPPFLRQIVSEARDANPTIRVHTAGKGSTELADIFTGIIGNIEHDSNGTLAYQTALWYAAACGEGYFYLDSDYLGPDTFEQKLKICSISNPELVFLDPAHEDITGADALYGFIVREVSRDRYEQEFGQVTAFEADAWISETKVRIAKYFVMKTELKTLYEYFNPETQKIETSYDKPAFDVLRTRKSETPYCMIYLVTGTDVLAETRWDIPRLPIFKVTGDEYFAGSEKITHGAVRFAKDAQRQYNYHLSKLTEIIDMAPKAPFIAAAGQIEQYIEMWQNANREPYGVLPYDPIHVSGSALPPPQRATGVDISSLQALMLAKNSSLEDMKLTFGLHDAALGRQGNEISGVAIEARANQSRRSNYHYFDNLVMAMREAGKILVQLIPVFYDTERTIRIVKPTSESQIVLINSLQNNYRYQITADKYEVTVSTGPAYASRKQETFEALQGIISVMPQAGEVLGDLIAKTVDNPIAELAALRLKAIIPPEVLAATGEETADMAPKEALQKAQVENAQLMKKASTLEQENADLKQKLSINEDANAIKLTQLDMENSQKMAQLQHQDQVAEIEARIKMKELELKEREIAIKEKELELKAAESANKMLDSMQSSFDMETPTVYLTEMDGDIGSDIGGELHGGVDGKI